MEYNEKITWSALEYEYKEKGKDWYFALGIITISASVASFLLDNILFSLLILISGLTVAMYGARKPKILKIELTERGVFVNKSLHPFNTLKSFWIEENEDKPKILFEFKKTFLPYVVIPIKDGDIINIRGFVSEFLQEEELHEPFAQKIMDYLGF